ncbi:hypothetical protein GCM10009544_09370 [Streptomyces stramineus]|uniref:DUF397 domain-containing protein n=1 Tax=Streptomyces stramineus TaxID=173861 RepID=A0ABN0ZIT9_9ACTN
MTAGRPVLAVICMGAPPGWGRFLRRVPSTLPPITGRRTGRRTGRMRPVAALESPNWGNFISEAEALTCGQ